jgi:hypothetical protein
VARPFVEFLQSQWLSWRSSGWPGRRGELDVKALSRDPDDGSCTVLLRYGPNWRGTLEPIGADEEMFVLSGALSRAGTEYLPHDYAFLPAGHGGAVLAGDAGAIVLCCFSAEPRPSPAADYDATRLVARVRASELPWDRTHMDPNIEHLNAWRKNLRLDPDGKCRTYLLGGLPDGYPRSGVEPLERHPHCEEMFMVAGDMPCSLGVMRAGAYFWRPPGIWHGADCTRNGFLCFMRTPGTNRTVSEWGAPHPVRWDPPFAPVLPADLAGVGRAPLPDPVQY